METMHPDVEKVLFSEEDIADMVKRLGAQISEDYKGKDLVLIAALRGAVVFMGDLMRAIDTDLAIDFMAVSSYGNGTKSSGTVRIIKDLDIDIKDRTFLWKDVEGKQAAIDPKYVGTHCPDEFVVGYGLDFAERYRNLPYVGILKPEVYA